MSLLLLGVGRGRNVTTVPSGDFQSDVVVHPDLGTVLGNVPGALANHGLLQQCAKHIVLDEDMSFTLPSGTHTIYYGHISLLPGSFDTNKPAWLTAGNGWTDSGLRGAIQVPDALSTLGSNITRTAVVYYYSASKSGTVTYAGHRTGAGWNRKLSHMVGFFLFPDGVAPTAKDPIINGFVPDISVAYSGQAPDEDSWFWDNSPITAAEAPTHEPATWSAFVTDCQNATAGHVISCPDGDGPDFAHADKGEVVITGLRGEIDDPITIQAGTFGRCALKNFTRLKFVDCEWVRVQGFMFIGDLKSNGHEYKGYIWVDQCGAPVHLRGNAALACGNFTWNAPVILIQSGYAIIGYNTFDFHKNTWQTINVVADQGDSFDHRYTRVYRNYFLNRVSGNGAQNMQFGSSNNQTQASKVYNSMCDHNWHYLYEGEPGELIGNKGRGHIVAHELIDQGIARVSSRSPKDGLFFANINKNSINQGKSRLPGSLQGQGNNAHTTIYDSHNVFALNHIDYSTSSNGQFDIIRTKGAVSGTNNDQDRWPVSKESLIANFVVDSTKRIIRSATDTKETGTPTATAVDIYFEGNACTTSAQILDTDDHDDWGGTWLADSSNVFNGTGSAPDSATKGDPGWSARVGDGLKLPTHASWSVPYNYHWPGFLEDPDDIRNNSGCGWAYK